MNLAIPLRKPSSRRLDQMLANEPAKFEKYLERFPELADRFEDFNPFFDLGGAARQTLENALAAPIDLASRMRQKLLDSKLDTSPLSLMLDISGIGIATLGFLFDERPLDPGA